MTAHIQEILSNDTKRLEAALNLDPGSARIEVQCLLQEVLQVDRAWLLAYAEQSLDDEQYSRYMELLERRLKGEPVAYLLGKREFYGLEFKVTPATLIPRPETELLVELALERLPSPGLSATLSHEWERGRGRGLRALDLGTGSGAIALSIAHARPDIEVVAVDASQDALEVARENMQRLNIGNVRLLQSNWFSGLRGEHYDLIVANPPYVATGDAYLSRGDLRYEPQSALASGTDGLDDIRHIVARAKAHLNPDGWLLLEHGHDQAARVRALLRDAGFASVSSARDLAGIERVTSGSSHRREGVQ